MKRILFLSNVIPSNKDAGGILYADIIKEYGIESFSFISLSYPSKREKISINIMNNVIKQYSFRIPPSNLFLKILRKMPLVEPLFLLINYKLYKNRILKLICKNNYDAIFAPLRGDVLLVLPDIISSTKLPLYAMVEDTVEREIDDFKLIYNAKKRSYYSLLKEVTKLGVAGETMQDYFKSKFEINSIILRPSFKSFSKIVTKIIDNELNIFFAGNTYAKKEIKAFIKALEYFVLSSDLNVTLIIASHVSFFTKSKKLIIRNLGWIEQEELKIIMEKCHIAYLPYKSETKFMHSMKYAFPSKSGFYVSNNLPIFFHGPNYSSFNAFLEKHPVGISCESMNYTIISSTLSSFITNSSFYSSCQDECKKAFKEEFDKAIFSSRVIEFFS